MSDDPFGIRSAPLRLDSAGPAAYVRTSPGGAGTDERGADEQRRILKRYANAESLGDLNWFADTGADGDSLDRIGLRRLITGINDGMVTHLLVASIDRLSTSRPQFVRLFDTYVEPQSVPLISVSEFVDTSSPRGKAIISMLRSFTDAPAQPATTDTEAQQRSASERKRVAESGAFAGGRVPFGYKRRDAAGQKAENRDNDAALRTLAVVPEEADIIRRVFAARQDGDSLRRIASMLNEDDIAAPNGGRWYASTVRYLLSNETYFGFRTYELDGETITQDLPHLQILDPGED